MMMHNPYGMSGAPPPPQMQHAMHMMHHDMQHAHMGYAPHPQSHYAGMFAAFPDQLDVEQQLPPPPTEPAPARTQRRGVKRNPDAPKRPMSPYVTFVKAKWSETYENMGPSAAAKDVMRRLGNVWNSMSEEDKEEWKTLSDADKARYADEMKSFDGPVTVPHDRRKKGAKKRGKKDPNAPKRGASAFLLFANDKRQTLREAHPDKHNVEISKMLGSMWKSSDEEAKAPYIEAESIARQRYDKEMEAYRQAQAAAQPPAPPPPDDDDDDNNNDNNNSNLDAYRDVPHGGPPPPPPEMDAYRLAPAAPPPEMDAYRHAMGGPLPPPPPPPPHSDVMDHAAAYHQYHHHHHHHHRQAAPPPPPPDMDAYRHAQTSPPEMDAYPQAQTAPPEMMAAYASAQTSALPPPPPPPPDMVPPDMEPHDMVPGTIVSSPPLPPY